MIRFVDVGDVTLADLVVDLESAWGPCEIVAGGRTKERALARFAETLRFPSWSGHNLDALYELLDEHAYAVTASGQDWTLVWVPSRRLATEHPRDYARVVAVLTDVANAHPRHHDVALGSRLVVVHGADPSQHPHHPDPPHPDPHPHPNPRSPRD